MTIEYKGYARTPGPLGSSIGSLGGRVPGPLRFEHVNAPAGPATKATKVLVMPAPASGDNILRARSVPLALSHTTLRMNDVEQGNLANCPIPAILAALLNTPKGEKRVNTLITEHAGVPVKTTFSKDVRSMLSSRFTDPDYKPPKEEIASTGYFTVHLGSDYEVSDVFYAEYTDRDDGELIYMHAPNKVIWPCLIEKAYAVKLDGYQKLNEEKIGAAEFWKVLVGSNPGGFKIDDETDLAKINAVAQAARRTPAIAASRDTTSKGVGAKHAYAILGIQSAKKLENSTIELYNAWGKRERYSLLDFRSNFQLLHFGDL